MLDGLSDLALTEGVHQAVLGNFDRVASTYDAFGAGGLPTEPEVVRTPGPGIGLTHRVALHLKPGRPCGAGNNAATSVGRARGRRMARIRGATLADDCLHGTLEEACRRQRPRDDRAPRAAWCVCTGHRRHVASRGTGRIRGNRRPHRCVGGQSQSGDGTHRCHHHVGNHNGPRRAVSACSRSHRSSLT